MTTEAETIADLAVSAKSCALLTTEAGREFLVGPHGVRDVSEPNALPDVLPDHIRQGVTLQTVDSLVDYTNRFKTPTTVLFADIAANRIAALIDYHDTAAPGHVSHRAIMDLPFSQEWIIWTSIHAKLMAQLDFARFIEENGGDIASPPAGDVLDAMRDLQAQRKVNFTKAVRTSSDNENFEYSDETNLSKRGGVEVPTRFELAIPVYFGGAATSLFAFLRWKLDDGALTLGVALNRAEHVRQAVFKQIVLDAGSRTERPVVFGKLAS